MLCLSFLVLGSTAQEAPTKSIANIVSDLLQVADPVPSIKEWTIDWQADLGDETRAALTPLHQAIDLTKLMEDILIGKPKQFKKCFNLFFIILLF